MHLPALSIVIACYNEAACLELLHGRVVAARVYGLSGVRSKSSVKNPEGVVRHSLKRFGECRKQFTIRSALGSSMPACGSTRCSRARHSTAFASTSTTVTVRSTRAPRKARFRSSNAVWRCWHRGEQHLQRYLAESEFCYNRRITSGVDNRGRAIAAVKGTVGKRITYRLSDLNA